MKLRILAGVLGGVLALTAAFWSAASSQAAPQELDIAQDCQPDGSLSVTFTWTDVDIFVVQQWLDLSVFDNGWQPGTFIGNGPLAAAQQKVTWTGLLQNTTHFVRINQWQPAGNWEASPTFYFTTGVCGMSPTTPLPPLVTPTPPASGDRTTAPAPIEDARVMSGTEPGHFVVQVKAGLPGGCAQKAGTEVTGNGTAITVKVLNSLPVGNPICTAIYGIYDVTVDLGVLTPGRAYQISVNDKQLSFAVP